MDTFRTQQVLLKPGDDMEASFKPKRLHGPCGSGHGNSGLEEPKFQVHRNGSFGKLEINVYCVRCYICRT